MTAFAGVFGPASESSDRAVREMLGEMRRRASGEPEEFRAPGAVLSIARHDWEKTVSGWSGPLLASDDHWMVAADASLYYVADLKRRLGVTAREVDSAELLLRALHRWGPRFARYIEGDYSIVAWERQRDRVLLARDFTGQRNLAYAVAGNSLVVASSPTAVIRHSMVSADYDVVFIALSTFVIETHAPRTAFEHVAVVPGGATLSFEHGRLTEVDRWTPPAFGSAWDSDSDQAAEALRSLLIQSVRERLDSQNPTSIWMSGGWDSTAVFAAAKASLTDDFAQRKLLPPISITYPDDDPGNEDIYIRAVADRWGVPVQWVDSDHIPLMADGDRRALLRDDPMPQAFEGFWRTLGQHSRSLGARVALDGFGGDHIFHVSGATVIADHLFYGRWSRLLEIWKSWPKSVREFARMSVLPHLSASVRGWIGQVRGRPLAGFWDRSLPSWIIQSPALKAELMDDSARYPGEGAAEYEARKGVNSTMVARAAALNHALGLDEGVQVRSPLLDQRVISFAASRPLSDRGYGGDTKRILRRAMAGLLPESVLESRSWKTGTTTGYVKRQLQSGLPAEIARVFGKNRSHLESLGVLDRADFLDGAEKYALDPDHNLGAYLYLTLETERWLAVRDAGNSLLEP